MRIHIISDLHLEFAPFVMPNVAADVRIIAGDLHPSLGGINWLLENSTKLPTIYVLGNHEFYGQKIPNLTQKIKDAARGSNIYVLENDAVELEGVLFFGATLWTDFALHGDPVLSQVAAQTTMTDFKRIRLSPTYRRFRPMDSRQFHAQTILTLAQELEKNPNKKVVVITHHAPSARSIAKWRMSDPLNPAYASNLDDFIASSAIGYWIHGHIHTKSDYLIGNCRVLANPRGYPGEVTEFAPDLVVDV